jgi:uncharacterized protein
MNCPVCQNELRPTERQGVEIDYCPKCRGVWLDRGELDKIIERSNSFMAENRHDDDDDDYRRHAGERHDYGHYGHKKRKKSFLGEIFDFD